MNHHNRVNLVVVDLSWVEFNLEVCCTISPSYKENSANFHLNKQNRADLNSMPTQPRYTTTRFTMYLFYVDSGVRTFQGASIYDVHSG